MVSFSLSESNFNSARFSFVFDLFKLARKSNCWTLAAVISSAVRAFVSTLRIKVGTSVHRLYVKTHEIKTSRLSLKTHKLVKTKETCEN